MKWNVSRRLLVLCLSWVGLAGLAQAQSASSETPAERPERDRTCLQSEALPNLPLLDAAAPQLLRVRLSFKPGIAEPAVDVLWNDFGAAAKEQLLAYLRSYRMPCLAAYAGPAAFVQEFWLRPQQTLLEAGGLWGARIDGYQPQSCAIGPPSMNGISMRGPVKVLAKIRFKADGSEPDFEVLQQTGLDRSALRALSQSYLALRSCPGGLVPKDWLYVSFTTGDAATASEPKPIGLLDLLGAMQGASALRAHFDTRTMSCPFKVVWMIGQPGRPNSAQGVGAYDANRAAFLGWLGSMKLDLPAGSEAGRFMEQWQVDVPCIVLDLAPKRAQDSGG